MRRAMITLFALSLFEIGCGTDDAAWWPAPGKTAHAQLFAVGPDPLNGEASFAQEGTRGVLRVQLEAWSTSLSGVLVVDAPCEGSEAAADDVWFEIDRDSTEGPMIGMGRREWRVGDGSSSDVVGRSLVLTGEAPTVWLACGQITLDP
jgi:hypothetical protein